MTTPQPDALLVRDEPIEVYLSKTDHWSHSMFEDARKSMPRCRATHIERTIETKIDTRTQDNFDVGNAVHCAVLEPDKYNLRWQLGPTEGRKTKGWTEALKDLPEGAKMLPPSVYSTVELMASNVRCHPVLGPTLEREGLAEASIYWKDAETGLLRRARPDWHRPPDGESNGVIVELKTFGRDTHPDIVARQFVNLGYHRKQANDTEAFRALYGVNPDVYVFAFVSKLPPHETAAFVLDDGSAELGEEQRRRDVERVAKAIEAEDFSQTWNIGVSTLVLPAYAHFAD